jgi:dolichol-phosphate mannosyltransferase
MSQYTIPRQAVARQLADPCVGAPNHGFGGDVRRRRLAGDGVSSSPAIASFQALERVARRAVVVIPTYNERENVGYLLAAVRAAQPEVDILVIDDNSPDGTGDLVEEVAGELGQIKLLRRPGKQGLGSAYRQGFALALDEGYDVIISMDVDFSHDPAVLGELLGLIDAGADAVIGSRYVRGGATVDWPLHRRLLSRWGNRYTALMLGVPVRDCTSGFRAYRATALRAIAPDTTTAEGFGFLTELVRRLIREECRVVETPITFRDRRFGDSKMSGRIIVESMLLVTQWGIRDALTGRPDGASHRRPHPTRAYA